VTSDADHRVRGWWDWQLFGRWVLVNAAVFVVIPVAGTALEEGASSHTKNLVQDHGGLAVVLLALVGAALQGFVLGRWQWRVIRHRLPGLPRRRWVVATIVPAFLVWVLVIAPGAVNLLAEGGATLRTFRNGFIQAVVLGPLLGFAQATALRGLTSRWRWWFAANVTTYVVGSALHQFGVWLQHDLSLPGQAPGYFPLVGFAMYGAWMVWVTAPDATSGAGAPAPPRRAPAAGRAPRAGSDRSQSSRSGPMRESDRPDRIPAVNPPSTTRAWPVTNDASSEARKRVAAATSSGRPNRPSLCSSR